MDGTMVLAIGFWLAFLGARLIRAKGIPELVGFLVVGAAIGPSGFGLVDLALLDDLKPVTAVATALLMFGIGERLSPNELRKQKFSLPAGALSSILTALFVFLLSLAVGASGAEAMMLCVLASAGAPMTVTALGAKARSPYSTALVGAHAVSDAIAAMAFSVVLPLAILMTSNDAVFTDALVSFLQLGVGSIVVGIIVGLVMARFSRDSEAVGEAMVLVLVHMVVLAVIAHSLHESIPLAALVAGVVVAMRLKGEKKMFVFKSVQRIEEPLFLVFFTIAGASIDLELLPKLGALGAMYLIGRSIGKIGGGFAGGKMTRMKTPDALRLGVDMVPQAGSAVALVVIATDQLPDIGPSIAVVVLGAVVVFEAIAPFFTAKNLLRQIPVVDETRAAPTTNGNAPTGPSVVVADYPQPQAATSHEEPTSQRPAADGPTIVGAATDGYSIDQLDTP